MNGIACVRIPVEAARKLQLFDNQSVEKIIVEHTREKRVLVQDNARLRSRLRELGADDEDLGDRESVAHIALVDEKVNECLLLSAHGEIERLRILMSGLEKQMKQMKQTINKMEWERDELVDKLRRGTAVGGAASQGASTGDADGWGDDWGEEEDEKEEEEVVPPEVTNHLPDQLSLEGIRWPLTDLSCYA